MADLARQAYRMGVGFLPPGARNLGRRVAERSGLNKYIPESDPFRKFIQLFGYIDENKEAKALAFLERERGRFNPDGYYTPYESDISSGEEHRGYTLLTLAIKRNQEAVVRALLASGANPRMQDKNLNTPLLVAIQRNHANQIKERVKQFSWRNDSPLLTYEDQNDGIIRLLLDAGASPNDEVLQGVPVLRWAIRQRNTPLLRLFVERGGTLNMLLPDGQSLLDYAEADVGRYGHPEILDVLRELGALTAAQMREGVQYIREKQPRILPRNATNIVSYVDIEDGTPMANFDDEFRFGRYYTEESFRTLPRMENPFTRQPINHASVRLYTAQIPPAVGGKRGTHKKTRKGRKGKKGTRKV